MAAAADLTLDELRLALAPRMADAAAFDGWSKAAVESAAQAQGVDPRVAALAFPGGAMDMIAAWIACGRCRDGAGPFRPPRWPALPVRERIRTLVRFRLEALEGREEALRRALANDGHAAKRRRCAAARLATAPMRCGGWRATRRPITTTIPSARSSPGSTPRPWPSSPTTRARARQRACAFLDRRIEGVMRFEKAKAQLLRSAGRALQPGPLARQAALSGGLKADLT